MGGNAANGVLQLAIFAVAAQALDLTSLGVLIVVQAYVRVVDGLLNFQSVNVLTHFLAQAQERGDQDRVQGLMKAGLAIDFGTAVLATLLAIAGLPLVAPLIGLGGEWISLAALFCCVIATRAFGAIEAGLRCFDRFGAIGIRPATASLAVLIGSLAAWANGASAQVFLLVWLIGEAAANLAFLGWSMIEIRRHGLTDLRTAKARDAIEQSRNFWPMLWQTNATFGIRMLSQDGDVVIAGAVLGPAAASLLRAAKNIANIVGQLGRPLQQVVSVPISRAVADQAYASAFKKALLGGLFAGGGALIAVFAGWLFGPFGLGLLFGVEFRAAADVLVWLLLAAAILMCGIATMPLSLALDRGDLVLRSTLWGSVAYVLAMPFLISHYALIGIGMAQVVFIAVWFGFNAIALRNELSKRTELRCKNAASA